MLYRAIVICLLLLTKPLLASDIVPLLEKHSLLNGQPLVLKPGPLYLKFWASWCQPCNQQMPHFQHSFTQYGDKIQHISINLGLNETPDAIAHTLSRHDVTIPTLVDSSGELAHAAKLKGTPLHLLIDTDGRIIHSGHDADTELDNKLALLARRESGQLDTITLTDAGPSQFRIDTQKKQWLFFTASWCHWYLKTSRPEQSKNCIQGQNAFNQLAKKAVPAQVVLSHLWTEDKDLLEYKDKFTIQSPMAIDKNNHAFIAYKIRQLPTLILIDKGKEVLRMTDFTNKNKLAHQISNYQ